MTFQELVDEIDKAIAPPQSLHEALRLLENLSAAIDSRIGGIEQDIIDQEDKS